MSQRQCQQGMTLQTVSAGLKINLPYKVVRQFDLALLYEMSEHVTLAL